MSAPIILPGASIVDDGRDRARWLAARRPLITATAATAIVGSNPYGGALDVWNEQTDPDYDADLYRSEWLDVRADFGREREAHIVQWMSEHPDVIAATGKRAFHPSTALYRLDDTAHGATFDALKVSRRGGTVTAWGGECKATQQDWATKGVPQHVMDQAYWQMRVGSLEGVVIAWEQVKWTGRNPATMTAEVVSQHVLVVMYDDVARHRLEWMLAQVAEFEQWKLEGIAPESIIDLDDLGFEADAELHDVRAELEGLRAIDAALVDLKAQREDAAERIKALVSVYAGRRVQLVSEALGSVDRIRSTKTKYATERLDPATRSSITSWSHSTSVTIKTVPPAAPVADVGGDA